MSKKRVYHNQSTPWKRFLLAGLAAGLCVAIPARTAQAQPGGQRVFDEQLRVRMDQQRPADREIGLDAGGWFNTAIFNYDDSLNENRTMRQIEMRLWGSLNIKNVHKFYVRGMIGWNDYNSGDNPKAYRQDDYESPNVERAWYEFDLGKMLQQQNGEAPPAGFRVKVGREYMDIGTALVLSMPLDMVKFDVELGDWAFMAMLGKTFKDEPNLDDSMPISTHQDRCFWGFQVDYKGLDKHQPFAYFLSNEDHSSPDRRTFDDFGDDFAQDFDYSSQYVGIGSRGSLILPDLRYRTELVGEWGKTYSNGQVSGRDDICAMAFDLLLQYYFKAKTSPSVMFEYLYGSGDSDRGTSSSSINGNRPGTTDHQFNAFGYRDTGIAFAPYVSNLNIYILGASFFPLENHKLLKKMELGTKVFFYQKAQASGPISDSTADLNSAWVGWEWDVYCNWNITSDLAWTTRYGAFQPGSAFSSQECRQYVYTGLTFSF